MLPATQLFPEAHRLDTNAIPAQVSVQLLARAVGRDSALTTSSQDLLVLTFAHKDSFASPY